MSYPNHREHAIALINEGGATRASLCETLGIKPTSLATVFSQLRLMGKCPIEDDNKVLRIGTPEEYEALKTAKTSNKKVLTPEEQLDAANKRVDRATKAYDRAAENNRVLPALDLVIAMPISWLPLVADYARHGKSGGSALRGTWLGYALANMWCYSLGVLVALTLPSTDLVQALLLAQGGLIALSLILIDEVDNAYGDTYSGAVSAHSLLPRWSIRRWGLAVAALCTGLALVLPMHSLEPFLLLLSSVFVPLFGVILGRLAFGTDAPALLAAARVGAIFNPINYRLAPQELAFILEDGQAKVLLFEKEGSEVVEKAREHGVPTAHWIYADSDAAPAFATARLDQLVRHQPATLPPPAPLADYGLALAPGAPAAASELALFILSPAGQRILAEHGFIAIGLPCQ